MITQPVLLSIHISSIFYKGDEKCPFPSPTSNDQHSKHQKPFAMWLLVRYYSRQAITWYFNVLEPPPNKSQVESRKAVDTMIVYRRRLGTNIQETEWKIASKCLFINTWECESQNTVPGSVRPFGSILGANGNISLPVRYARVCVCVWQILVPVFCRKISNSNSSFPHFPSFSSCSNNGDEIEFPSVKEALGVCLIKAEIAPRSIYLLVEVAQVGRSGRYGHITAAFRSSSASQKMKYITQRPLR